MDLNLKKLLVNCNYDDEPNYTHITTYPEVRKWNVKTNKLSDFWQNYCQLAQNKKGGIFIKEKIGNKTPFISLIKFRFHKTDDIVDWRSLIKNNFLIALTYCYQFVIFDQMTIDKPEHQLSCSILYHEPYFKGDEVYISLRLHFQYLKTDLNAIKNRLLPEIIKKLSLEKILSKLDHSPIDSWNTMIQIDCLNDSLTMFGSSDGPDIPVWELACTFHQIEETDLADSNDDESYFPDQEVESVYNLNRHSDVINGSIDTNNLPEEDPIFYLPMFFSTLYGNTLTFVKENKNTPMLKLSIKIEGNEELELCEKFLGMIDFKNLDYGVSIRMFWKYVGEILYISSKAEKKKGLTLWLDYTKNFIEPLCEEKKGEDIPKIQECIKLYYTFNNSKLTYRTLAFYARETNINEYNKWHKSRYSKLMTKALSATHDDVAAAIYEYFFLEFAFDGSWFFYDRYSHHWIIDLQETRIKEYIKTKFVDKLETFRTEMSVKIQETKNEDERNRYERYMKDSIKLIDKIKMDNYKTQVIHSLRSCFCKNTNFSNLLDESVNFTGMNNCVIDVSEGKNVSVRRGKPEDYLSKSTGVDYPFSFDNNEKTYIDESKILFEKYGIVDDDYASGDEEPLKNDEFIKDEKHEDYDDITRLHEEKRISLILGNPHLRGWKHKHVRQLIKWLAQVFVDRELLRYFLKDSSSFLKSGNQDKKLRIWSGYRDASKSMVVKLFKCLGVYHVNLPSTFMSGKDGSSSNATPQIARTKATRIGIMAELGENTPIDSATAKKYVSNDSYYGRGLYNSGTDITMSLKVVLMCNHIPHIIGISEDEALIEKLLVLPFLSRWSIYASEDLYEQYKTRVFPMDPSFEEKIPEFYSSFIWLMVKFYPLYIREGLKPPAIVKKYTEEYVESRDPYNKFKEEMLVYVYKDEKKTELDLQRKISFKTIYDAYKVWYKDNYPGAKVQKSDIAKREIIRRLGPQTGHYWLGIALVDQGNGIGK
jgi:hypothetical protein